MLSRRAIKSASFLAKQEMNKTGKRNKESDWLNKEDIHL
jgi:hypothetical protein